MQFFSKSEMVKSWSVQVWSLVPILATIDFSTTWLDMIVPVDYKPVVYGSLALLGIIARTIKQPKISGS